MADTLCAWVFLPSFFFVCVCVCFSCRLIAIDDLRPLFGRSYGVEEVLTPNFDKYFLDGQGSVMQNSYVQIAVCGPSRRFV